MSALPGLDLSSCMTGCRTANLEFLDEGAHDGGRSDSRHPWREPADLRSAHEQALRGGQLPDGWQIHLAGPTADGWRIINVVPSQEQFEAFAREQLIPAVQQAENVTPQLSFFPVYRLIRT